MKLMEEETKIIRAVYNETTIRVYQAYRDEISDEAVSLNRFGKAFSMGRMTWIKPSFLWMMYRSGWASKEGQTRILAIDMKRAGFDKLVQAGVVSSFDKNETAGLPHETWQEQMKKSDVVLQWDPEHDIYGKALQNTRSLQIGIRGALLKQWNEEWIETITDITPFVKEQKSLLDQRKLDFLSLPVEKEYSKNSEHGGGKPTIA